MHVFDIYEWWVITLPKLYWLVLENSILVTKTIGAYISLIFRAYISRKSKLQKVGNFARYPFHHTGLFLHPLKTSKNICFPLFSGGIEGNQWHEMANSHSFLYLGKWILYNRKWREKNLNFVLNGKFKILYMNSIATFGDLTYSEKGLSYFKIRHRYCSFN